MWPGRWQGIQQGQGRAFSRAGQEACNRQSPSLQWLCQLITERLHILGAGVGGWVGGWVGSLSWWAGWFEWVSESLGGWVGEWMGGWGGWVGE